MRLFIIFIFFFILSCTGVPNKQISFDLSDKLIPVMLTESEISCDPAPLSFYSGYSSKSPPALALGDNYVNDSSYENNINQSISDQLENIFHISPNFLIVSSIELRFSKIVSLFFGNDEECILYLNLLSPKFFNKDNLSLSNLNTYFISFFH